MSTPKPDWVGEYGASYDDIVKGWPYATLAFETFGSYQGDHLALLRGSEGIGLIVFGYGSCSGCDALEGLSPWGSDEDADWGPVIDFANDLQKGIHWEPTREALREWINTTPENHWWSWDEQIAKWLNDNLETSLKTRDDE